MCFYARIGGYFFSHQEARDVVTEYYQQLLEVLASNDVERVIFVVRKYGIESGKIWQQVRQDLPTNIVD
jgi:GntR family negative regulator for fad regulon and positive regulator of fabA